MESSFSGHTDILSFMGEKIQRVHIILIKQGMIRESQLPSQATCRYGIQMPFHFLLYVLFKQKMVCQAEGVSQLSGYITKGGQ
jgi:hypothetical protein